MDNDMKEIIYVYRRGKPYKITLSTATDTVMIDGEYTADAKEFNRLYMHTTKSGEQHFFEAVYSKEAGKSSIEQLTRNDALGIMAADIDGLTREGKEYLDAIHEL